MMTVHYCLQDAVPNAIQGLLNKRPGDRLGWPGLLEHPFVRESSQERLKRETALADAAATAQESRAWKGEGGAVAGHYTPRLESCCMDNSSQPCATALCCMYTQDHLPGCNMQALPPQK